MALEDGPAQQRPTMWPIPRGPGRSGMRGLLLVLLALMLVVVAEGHRASQRVPPVVGEDLAQAYVALHDAKLKVTIPQAVAARGLAGGGSCLPDVTGAAPRAGTHVPRYATVTLALAGPGCTAASRNAPPPKGRRRVPSFTGRSLLDATGWAQSHRLPWTATLPPLRGATARTLYGNYRVTGGRGAPDGTLALTVAR